MIGENEVGAIQAVSLLHAVGLYVGDYSSVDWHSLVALTVCLLRALQGQILKSPFDYTQGSVLAARSNGARLAGGDRFSNNSLS